MITEITVKELDAERFIDEKVGEIRAAVGEGTAINALSGGVDSSTVTMLGHRALGGRLKTVFIETDTPLKRNITDNINRKAKGVIEFENKVATDQRGSLFQLASHLVIKHGQAVLKCLTEAHFLVVDHFLKQLCCIPQTWVGTQH